jgi:hypothetical protein
LAGFDEPPLKLSARKIEFSLWHLWHSYRDCFEKLIKARITLYPKSDIFLNNHPNGAALTLWLLNSFSRPAPIAPKRIVSNR